MQHKGAEDTKHALWFGFEVRQLDPVFEGSFSDVSIFRFLKK